MEKLQKDTLEEKISIDEDNDFICEEESQYLCILTSPSWEEIAQNEYFIETLEKLNKLKEIIDKKTLEYKNNQNL